MRAYRRNDDGTLEITTLSSAPLSGTDSAITDGHSFVHPTKETQTLRGWPDDFCRVWKSDYGVEYLIPEKHIDQGLIESMMAD